MKSKWALITGASSGIGEATAIQFAAAGCNLILVARRQDRLEKLKKRLSSVEVHVHVLDMQDTKQIAKFISENHKLLQNVDILVNNAGLAKGSEKVDAANPADWDEMMDTNVRGLMHMTRGMLPMMIKNGYGHIINMGSAAGRWVYPGGAVYCASKFAVRAFSEGLRQDLLGKNIRVTVIEPGMVETEFSVVRFGDQAKADAVYKGMKPLTAEDIADTIFWTAQRPAHINIQEVVMYPTDQAHVGMVHRK